MQTAKTNKLRTLIKTILIFLGQIVFLANAQTSDSLKTSEIVKKTYIDFLTRNDKTENYMFSAGIKYRYTVYSPSFSTNGYYLTAGINLARFFSRKLVLGAFVDFTVKHNLFQQDIKSDEFVSDFNKSFNTTYNTQEDSAVAREFQSDLTNKNFGKGGYAGYGVMFSPFPNKYGGVLISAKYGTTSHFCSFYGNKYVNNGESDHIYFNTEIYTLELTLKPYTFFRNDSYWKGKNFIYRGLSISFSYDYFKITNITVYNTKLTDMVNNDFISKYGTTNRFIVSLGWTLY